MKEGIRSPTFAARLGLTLDAFLVDGGNATIDRSVLMLFRIGEEGHFVVGRPVGRTGQLVQVLDGERTPTVLDFERLARLPSWTGLALAPRRPNSLLWMWLAGGLAMASAWATIRLSG